MSVLITEQLSLINELLEAHTEAKLLPSKTAQRELLLPVLRKLERSEVLDGAAKSCVKRALAQRKASLILMDSIDAVQVYYMDNQDSLEPVDNLAMIKEPLRIKAAESATTETPRTRKNSHRSMDNRQENKNQMNTHVGTGNTNEVQAGEQFAYCRVSTKDQSLESQTSTIKAEYPEAHVIGEHGVSGKVPARERAELAKLLDTRTGLRKGDTLIVWWFDRIGRDYQDAKNTATELLKRGVTIRTINQSLELAYTDSTTQNMMVDMMLTMLAGMADNERQARLASAEAGRDKLRGTDAWTEKYQGRKTDEEQYKRILSCLYDDELSIRKTAQLLGCGVSTVQRAKKRFESEKTSSGLD